MEIGGMVKTEDFARWVCTKHRMERIVVETPEQYVRPNMWVVLRRVPRYYRLPPPPKPVSAPVEKTECYNIENDMESEFGPDPMSQRPEKPKVWRRRPTERIIPFVPMGDEFAVENMFY